MSQRLETSASQGYWLTYQVKIQNFGFTMTGLLHKNLISLYDFQGLCFGVLMASLSLVLLKGAGLVTGQTAGLALLLSYALPVNFGVLFFVIGFPFLILGWMKRGTIFALRTLFAILSISVLAPFMATMILFDTIDPLVAALTGGACASIGIIALFRHNASAGGITILALIIEQKTGFKSGWSQLIFDAGVFVAALFVLDPVLVACSFAGALMTNLMIAWNFNIGQNAPKARPWSGAAGDKGNRSDNNG